MTIFTIFIFPWCCSVWNDDPVLTDMTDTTGGQIRCQHLSVCWLSWEPTLRPAVLQHRTTWWQIWELGRHTVSRTTTIHFLQSVSDVPERRIILLDYPNITRSNTLPPLTHSTKIQHVPQMFVTFLYNFDVAGSQFNKNMVDISPISLRKRGLCMFLWCWIRAANI